MASGAVAALLSPSLPHRTFTNGTFCAKFSSNPLFLPLSHKSSRQISISASAAATRGKKSEGEKKDAKDPVPMISTIDEFEATLKEAKNRLVVVEYAASHSVNSKKIYPAMVELSRSCPDVVFRLILGDESDDTKELCRRANITRVPYFIFYKNEEVVHEEEGMDEDMLLGDVLYYGETGNLIRQLHGKADVEELMNQSANGDGRLLVLDVGLKHCGPCVKVYPTVVKLARKMQDTAIFARLDGDESEDCMEYLRNMNVVEVPTFVFIKNGEICGRYVGSSRGELIGEILRYQGVKIT